MPRTNFNVETHGYKFRNGFTNNRFFGPIHLEFGGRCGGMVYSALDYFFTNKPVPDQRDLPIEGSVLSTYISGRQERSTLNTVDKWVELSVNPFGWRTAEFFNWGLQDHDGGRLEELCREIDNGRPAPLGLYNPDDLLKHHQVMAIGYEGRGSELKICIYDPNFPGTEKILRPHPDEFRFWYDSGGGHKWLTYFVDLNYRTITPPSADDLSGRAGPNLTGQNLSGQNLSNKNYRNAVCIGTNFSGATINQSDFESADMDRANFQGANLRNSNFSKADLNHAVFIGADLKDTRFLSAILRKANFRGADLKLANLSNSNLTWGDFYGADLHQSVVCNCNCDQANFYGASLRNADLSSSTFRSANLTGADLRNANLSNSNFTEANLAGANLAGANTTGAVGL